MKTKKLSARGVKSPVVEKQTNTTRSLGQLTAEANHIDAELRSAILELRDLCATFAQTRVLLDDLKPLASAIKSELARHHLGLQQVSSEVALLLEKACDSDPALKNKFDYMLLVRNVRNQIRMHVPAGRMFAVISKGDEGLINVEDRTGRHFPQDSSGDYPGFAPADSGSAIIQLEALRSQGLDYLVIPSTALWWLDHYVGLREYLDRHYRIVVQQDKICVIYALRETHPTIVHNVWSEFARLLNTIERDLERDIAVLDWNTNIALASRMPRRNMFSPPTTTAPSEEPSLPYLNRTIDVVAIASSHSAVLSEAKRVAAVAVVVFTSSPRSGQGSRSEVSFDVQWVTKVDPKPLPSASIIIPSYNGVELTEACIRALQETLPREFHGEIIVVDDASQDDTPQRMQVLAEQNDRIVSVRNPRNLGFVVTCNRGAERATSDVLILLNNDTLPQPGWLEALLKTFEDHSDAGAVGGKLVYPDGRLQEAGGVVFSDGSAANFGRGDYEIDAPLYNYFREVDYVTGALIATPRALFEKLGGLDDRYRPIYYEETDYCFRVRDAGLKVYYQPASVVIHLEGATCGTNPSGGQKRYQLVNREKFVDRWSRALRRQPDNPHHFDAWTWYGLAVRGERILAESGPDEVNMNGKLAAGGYKGDGRGGQAR